MLKRHEETLIKHVKRTMYPSKAMKLFDADHIPTRPKRTQYNAANIGKGIDANTAPNFPVKTYLEFQWGKSRWRTTLTQIITSTFYPQCGESIYQRWRRISWSLQISGPLSDSPLEKVLEVPRFPWINEEVQWSRLLWMKMMSKWLGEKGKLLHRNSRTRTSSKETIKQDPYSLPNYQSLTCKRTQVSLG